MTIFMRFQNVFKFNNNSVINFWSPESWTVDCNSVTPRTGYNGLDVLRDSQNWP